MFTTIKNLFKINKVINFIETYEKNITNILEYLTKERSSLEQARIELKKLKELIDKHESSSSAVQ